MQEKKNKYKTETQTLFLMAPLRSSKLLDQIKQNIKGLKCQLYI